jgi:hypothetical protein
MHLQRLCTHYLRLSPRRCKSIFIPFWKIQLRLCFRRGVSYLSISHYHATTPSDIPPTQCRSHRKDFHSFRQDKRPRRSGTSFPPVHPRIQRSPRIQRQTGLRGPTRAPPCPIPRTHHRRVRHRAPAQTPRAQPSIPDWCAVEGAG